MVVGDRRLIAGTAAVGVCAAGLVFLPSGVVLPSALVIGLFFAAYLARWVYRDAEEAGQFGAGWAATMIVWPLAMPPYLILSRGMRGLLLAAGVLFVFFLLPFSYVGAIFRQDAAAGRLIEKGRQRLWKAENEKGISGKKEALAMFTEAARISPRSYDAIMMVFMTAFDIGLPDVAEEHYVKLQAIHRGGPGGVDAAMSRWYLAALQYQDFALEYRLAAAGRVLKAGDAEALAAEGRAVMEHRTGVLLLYKEWEAIRKGFSEKRRKEYAGVIGEIDAMFARFGESAWKPEKAAGLAVKLASSVAWRQAIESYGEGLRAQEAGESEAAVRHFAEAAEVRTDFAEPELLLGALHMDAGRSAEGATAARRAIDRLKKHGSTLFSASDKMNMAVAFALIASQEFDSGRIQAAKEHLSVALRFEPRCELARALQVRISPKEESGN